jgi:hypothetical protein
VSALPLVTDVDRLSVFGNSPEVLERILEPDVYLAQWRRAVEPEIVSWVCRMAPDLPPDGRFHLYPKDTDAVVSSLLRPSAYSQDRGRAGFIRDVSDLVARFSRLASSPTVDIRLDLIEHDACWKFHRDRTELRMLCTYLGPGTQYVPDIYGEQAIRDQRDYTGPVTNIPARDIALFKGDLRERGVGVVHRSPPIVGTGKRRLLLCINKPSEISPPLWRGRGRNGA